jgi:hypothetical protein
MEAARIVGGHGRRVRFEDYGLESEVELEGTTIYCHPYGDVLGLLHGAPLAPAAAFMLTASKPRRCVVLAGLRSAHDRLRHDHFAISTVCEERGGLHECRAFVEPLGLEPAASFQPVVDGVRPNLA